MKWLHLEGGAGEGAGKALAPDHKLKHRRNGRWPRGRRLKIRGIVKARLNGIQAFGGLALGMSQQRGHFLADPFDLGDRLGEFLLGGVDAPLSLGARGLQALGGLCSYLLQRGQRVRAFPFVFLPPPRGVGPPVASMICPRLKSGLLSDMWQDKPYARRAAPTKQ
ncbi:hypothetical protein [Streptosporangium sp. V21-05]|uniref:hypothetical protein n=1 Tax=Streptosporangium sp. V21-05 TaxID=3446115 RepID=UPI003F52AE7D